MGKIVEKKKKKKGRPSLLDLQKRSLKEQQQQQNPNFTPNSHFRNPNQNRGFNLRNSNSDAVSADPERIDSEGNEDEEGDSKREKKLKFVVRLSANQQSTSFNSADSNTDEGNEETQLKKRKINAVRDRSVLRDGEKEEKQNSGSAADDDLAGTHIESVPTTPLPDKKLMVFILDRLQKKDTYGVFSEPVDPKELPDYHEIIEHPMDFGTVRKNLLGGVYANLEQFEKDVFLICSNAMRYNSADTIYFRQARSIQELAKRDFDNLRQDSDDNDPRPKVVRRGRPPTKNLKKNIGGQSFERAGSEFSSATLATGGDATSWSNSYDLRKGLSGSAEALGRTSNKSRPGGAYNGLVEHRSDGNDEFPASVLKGMSKFGKKHFILDENRRNTYKQSHATPCGREESVLNTFDGEKKQLMAVGFHMEYSFARSLARFAATLGPIAWKIASKKIERALPAGMKFGPGWVGEQEKTEMVTSQQSQPTPYQAQSVLPQQASSLPKMSSTVITSSLTDKERKQQPSGDPASDIHSNKVVSSSLDVHLSRDAIPSNMVSSSSDVHSNRAAAPTTMVHPNRSAPPTTVVHPNRAAPSTVTISSSSDIHPNRVIPPTTRASSSSDFHSNKAISPPTMVSSSSMVTDVSPELAKECGGAAQVFNYQGGFSLSDSSGAAVMPHPSFQIQQAPLLKNGFSGGFGYNPASQSQTGKSVRTSAPLGGSSPKVSTNTQILSKVSSINNNVLQSKPASHPESDENKFQGGANTLNSGKSATDSRRASQSGSEKLLNRQPSGQGLLQPQQSDAVPPDLNVRSQSPGSPGLPQQPDLVLQL